MPPMVSVSSSVACTRIKIDYIPGQRRLECEQGSDEYPRDNHVVLRLGRYREPEGRE